MGSKYRGEDIVFQDVFASGWSEETPFGKFCGARSCLRVVVTPTTLHAYCWFPVPFLAKALSLCRVIRLDSIRSVDSKKILWRTYLSIRYQDDSGASCAFAIASRNEAALASAISRKGK